MEEKIDRHLLISQHSPLQEKEFSYQHVSGASLRTCMASIGDINQDGAHDMIIGTSGAGLAYVLFGQSAWSCSTCETFSTCKNATHDIIIFSMESAVRAGQKKFLLPMALHPSQKTHHKGIEVILQESNKIPQF